MTKRPNSAPVTNGEMCKAILESAVDYAIFTLDTRARVTSWNNGARRILGYNRKEIIGKSGRRLFTPADRKNKAPEKERAAALRFNRANDERWHVKKNGERFWASGIMMPLRDTDGQLLGFLKILRDRTSEKLIEASQRRFTTLVQNVRDYAIMLLDRNGHVSEWNEGAARLKGYSAKEIIGKHFRVFYPRDEQRNKQPERELFIAATRGRSEAEGWRVRKDGSRFWVNEIVTPIHDSTHKLMGFAKISRDLTERREAEEALRMMNESLERRVQERTAEMEEYQSRLRSLAAQLSKTQEDERHRIAGDIHDNLAQLLAVCLMRLSGVKKRVSDPALEKPLNDIENYIDQATKYARSLMLNLSPPVLRKRELVPAMEWLADEMETHGLNTSIRDDGKLKPVSGEVFTAIFQGVRELLFNVIKHAGINKAAISLKSAGKQVRVQVRDWGVGVASTADGERGFGLFALRERLRLVGGSLEFQALKNKGTTVTIVAPLDDESEPNGRLYAEDPFCRVSPDLETIRLLIVDDHKMMRDGLRKILEEQPDIEIVGEATDGGMADKMVTRLRPDIVLMDVNMPKVDGIEATRRITSKKNSPSVIGLSIHEDKDTEQSLRKAGACDYVSKRETAEKLYSRIRHWANRTKKSK